MDSKYDAGEKKMKSNEDVLTAALSHQGMVRKDNQDSHGYVEPASAETLAERGRLFIVADGLGGHRGGQVASKMAVDVISRVYYSGQGEPVYPALMKAMEAANSEIFQTSAANADLQGMATTCTILVERAPHLYMAHVGDSRAYLIRDGALRQISRDHTLVEEMVSSGILSHEEAKSHPDSHILTRSLGIVQSVEVDILDPPMLLKPGDSLLMCSDGLTAYLGDDEIRQSVLSHTPEEACRHLVETGNSRGGRDNITVQIIHIARKGSHDREPHKEATSFQGGASDHGHGQGEQAAPENGTVGWGWAASFYLVYALFTLLYFSVFFRN